MEARSARLYIARVGAARSPCKTEQAGWRGEDCKAQVAGVFTCRWVPGSTQSSADGGSTAPRCGRCRAPPNRQGSARHAGDQRQASRPPRLAVPC